MLYRCLSLHASPTYTPPSLTQKHLFQHFSVQSCNSLSVSVSPSKYAHIVLYQYLSLVFSLMEYTIHLDVVILSVNDILNFHKSPLFLLMTIYYFID